MNNETKMAQIAKNKSLLKEYSNQTNDRIVYLADGDEFQIQIYNPTKEVVSAEIYLNGDKISNSLVLRPAERIWLDRYLDKAKKFKFNTYTVDGDQETQEIIKKNGEVMVRFYREDKTAPKIVYISNATDYYKPYEYTTDVSISTGDYVNLLNTLTSTTNSTIETLNCAENYNINYDLDASSLKGSSLTSFELSEFGNYATKLSEAGNSIPTASAKLCDDTIETGRIDAGSHSDQEFENVDKTFSTWCFHTDIIKILPISQKPVGAADLQKTYCPECGHKLKNTYKFCPYCGSKLEE